MPEQTPRLKDIAPLVALNGSESKEVFLQQVKEKIGGVQVEYVKKVFGLINPDEIDKKVKSLGSKIEPLLMVDENDTIIPSENGWWGVEFRKDLSDTPSLPEAKEQPLYRRIALFIVEDKDGNIIVSRRSFKKSHPGELEMAGGHVIAGDSYLQTVYKEVQEELGYELTPGSVTEANRVCKYRNLKPGNDENKGGGNILSVYNITVPDVSKLSFDPEEIEELKVFTKQELFEAISTGKLKGEELSFASHHAYRYLEFLENRCGIDTKAAREKMVQDGKMKNRTKMETFGSGE